MWTSVDQFVQVWTSLYKSRQVQINLEKATLKLEQFEQV